MDAEQLFREDADKTIRKLLLQRENLKIQLDEFQEERLLVNELIDGYITMRHSRNYRKIWKSIERIINLRHKKWETYAAREDKEHLL